jgi:hypothetical protein
MDSNRPKHGRDQGESPPVPERKAVYSALYGVYTEVLRDLMAVLEESAAKGDTAKITTTEPPSNKEFCEQRR